MIYILTIYILYICAHSPLKPRNPLHSVGRKRSIQGLNRGSNGKILWDRPTSAVCRFGHTPLVSAHSHGHTKQQERPGQWSPTVALR